MVTLSPKIHDLTGQKFELITVLGFNHSTNGRTFWLCQCDCGNKVVKRSDCVKIDTSCGCYHRAAVTKHNLCHSSEYKSYQAIIQRCTNENSLYYPGYGGRGITICDRWLNSFENFFSDMGKRPKGLSLERIDNNKGYEPGNCKWATKLEQDNNRRSNTFLTCGGKTQTIAQWTREKDLRKNNIEGRLKLGWSIDRAINTPNPNIGRISP